MKNNAAHICGMNIYSDRYGNTVYYNIFNKVGYIISKDYEQKFRVLYNRYSIIIVVLILLGDYFKTLENTLIVGAIALILVEMYFRMHFLKKLKSIENFKREHKISKMQQTIKQGEKDKTVMKALAYMAFGVLLIINALQQNFNTAFIALSGIASVYSFYSGIINMIAFAKMKPNIKSSNNRR